MIGELNDLLSIGNISLKMRNNNEPKPQLPTPSESDFTMDCPSETESMRNPWKDKENIRSLNNMAEKKSLEKPRTRNHAP